MQNLSLDLGFRGLRFRNLKNQVEETMENEMEAGYLHGYTGVTGGLAYCRIRCRRKLNMTENSTFSRCLLGYPKITYVAINGSLLSPPHAARGSAAYRMLLPSFMEDIVWLQLQQWWGSIQGIYLEKSKQGSGILPSSLQGLYSFAMVRYTRIAKEYLNYYRHEFPKCARAPPP